MLVRILEKIVFVESSNRVVAFALERSARQEFVGGRRDVSKRDLSSKTTVLPPTKKGRLMT